MELSTLTDESKVNEWLRYVGGHYEGTKNRYMHSTCPERDYLYRSADAGCTAVEQSIRQRVEECYVVSIPRRSILGFIDTQEWYKQNRQGFPMHRLDEIIRRHYNEKNARDENPAAKKAWEQYRLLLKLSTSDDVIDDLNDF